MLADLPFYFITLNTVDVNSIPALISSCQCIFGLSFVSESESRYDWRSVSRSVLVSSPIWGSRPDIEALLHISWCRHFILDRLCSPNFVLSYNHLYYRPSYLSCISVSISFKIYIEFTFSIIYQGPAKQYSSSCPCIEWITDSLDRTKEIHTYILEAKGMRNFL
jgi:hypothetical protein